VSIKSIPNPYISETVQKLWKIVKYVFDHFSYSFKGVGGCLLQEATPGISIQKFQMIIFESVGGKDRLYEHSV